jgi:diaminopropionate ammonia-lyase
MPAFPTLDMAYRDRQRRALEDSGQPAVLVGSPTMLRWLAGIDGWGCYVPQFLLLSWAGAGRVRADAVMRGMDANGVPRDAVDAVHVYPDDAVDSDHLDPVATTVVPLLLELGLGDLCLGIEANAAYFRARYLQELQDHGHATVDCTRKLNWTRLIKSEAELESVRLAAVVSDAAMSAAAQAAVPGARRCDVAAAILAQQTRSGGRSAIPPIVVQHGHGAHENWDSDVLRPGSALRIELSGEVNGYHAPLSRTIVLPSAPAELEAQVARQTRVLVAALAAGVRALRPGVKCAYVHHQVSRVLEANQMTRASRVGYSFGLGMTPDWGEGSLSVRAGSTDVVREGACIHLILGCGDGWEVQMSEACVVGPHGAELLCRTPRQALRGGRPAAAVADDPWAEPTLRMALRGRPSWGLAWAAGVEPVSNDGSGNGAAVAEMRRRAKWAQMAHREWWPGLPGGCAYDPTPVHRLDDLGRAMGVASLVFKDETQRMGGRSFKMLGTTAAVHQLLREGRFDPATQALCTMSDGNHGAALAAVGMAVGARVEVWLPRDVGPAATDRLAVLGATIHRVDGSYDEAVAAVALECEREDRVLVSDTAVDDHTDVPQTIAAGYLTLFDELEWQLDDHPTHVFVQTGVGGLAMGCAAWLAGWTADSPAPRMVVVEAVGSACYLASRHAARSTTVATQPTEMEGLNCGTPSSVAWPLVAARAAGYVAVGDEYAELAVRMLGGMTAPTGASGLAGFAAAMSNPMVAAMLGLNCSSRVVCIVTEAA